MVGDRKEGNGNECLMKFYKGNAKLMSIVMFVKPKTSLIFMNFVINYYQFEIWCGLVMKIL